MEKYKYFHRLFIAIQDKHLHSFVIFDIKGFCPPINEKLSIKALKFVEPYTVPMKINASSIIQENPYFSTINS